MVSHCHKVTQKNAEIQQVSKNNLAFCLHAYIKTLKTPLNKGNMTFPSLHKTYIMPT